MINESSVNQINNNSQNHYYIIKDYFLWFYIYEKFKLKINNSVKIKKKKKTN